ncbi:N-acetylmuramidase domain-containing protein [Ottowia pentelensis]|uniref:N-acetylmuramidase domain-containing protein n=1 Tax=Ottowia pentelensis TaxID=511108 RepID=UPI00362B1060
MGQVMGFNADAAGFQSARDMVTQMAESESAQLAGMARFMASQGLDARLRARDWTGFARRYNGPSYWKNAYDVKLKSAFEKFSSGISRDLRARAAQGRCCFWATTRATRTACWARTRAAPSRRFAPMRTWRPAMRWMTRCSRPS